MSCAGSHNQTQGFIHLQGSAICRGPYSPALVQEWYAWDEAHGSENQPVDDFDDAGQLFALIVTADGGHDLDHFAVQEFQEARSILFQVQLRSWLCVAPGSLQAIEGVSSGVPADHAGAGSCRGDPQLRAPGPAHGQPAAAPGAVQHDHDCQAQASSACSAACMQSVMGC